MNDGMVTVTNVQLTHPRELGLEFRREPAMLGIRFGWSTCTGQCELRAFIT